MNIGINTLFHIPGQVGGTETYLLEILGVFDRADTHHVFTVFTHRGNDDLLRDKLRSNRWTFIQLPFCAQSRVQRISREQTELPLKAWRAGIDVLWSPGYTAPLWCRCPQVVTIHDMQYKTFPEDLSPLARWTLSVLVQAASRSSKFIVAVSEFSRSEILKYTSARPQDVHVILEAAASDFASSSPKPALRQGDPFILCVGHSYPHKRIDQLVRAYGLVQRQIPHRLVLVGRRRGGDHLVAREIGLLSDPSRCTRMEGISRQDLAQLYSETDLFVFPSQYEGFGLPILEALTAGAPVVTTRCGSIPEIGGDAVLYYDHQSDRDLGDKMLEALNRTDSVAEAWREKGIERAGRFRWAETAWQTLRLLERAVS